MPSAMSTPARPAGQSGSNQSTTALRLPRLRLDQWRIVSHPAKMKVLAMGRRWGKTVMGGCVSLGMASQGGHVAWIVPIYKNGRPLWRWCESAVSGLGRRARVNRAERTIEFPEYGGFLGVYSADSPDSVRGEAFHLVVLDEAARIAEEVWTDSIQPTLADYGGEAILISTPRGHNWFWIEAMRAQADGRTTAFFTAPSSDNPNPRIKRAAELARERVPERTYRQEWLAEFVEDGGGVFRRVLEAATATRLDKAQEHHAYVVGCDWGRSEDYTVFSVVDVKSRELVYLDRSNKVEYALQRGRLKALCERFHPVSVLAEENAMGAPIIEQLRREGIPVRPFVTTNATKAEIIDGLTLAFEQGDIKILNDPVLVGELQAFQSERLPSGLMRYGAPAGLHDDCVMSLALAWYAAVRRGVGFG